MSGESPIVSLTWLKGIGLGILGFRVCAFRIQVCSLHLLKVTLGLQGFGWLLLSA